ncbi:MAG: hypothetical protein FGM24_02770 [Candidatus Kapabacteria bacterium]|nr:hypothetical protein [Candidatus Kapabacteria bacterium]
MVRMVQVLLCLFLATHAMIAAERHDILASAVRPDTLSVSHPATYFTVSASAYSLGLRIPDRTTIEVPLDVPDLGRVTLQVERFRVFAPDAVLTAMTEQGQVPIVKPESILLRGSIKGVAGSHVMLACHPHYAVGYIDIRTAVQDRRFLISPTAMPFGKVTMIVFDERFAKHPQPWDCGTDDSRKTPIDERKGKGGEQTQAGTLRRIEMAIEGDFTYFQDHGNNAVTATDYAEDVIAACSDIYERDVAGNLFIKRWNLWTVNDPWPGTNSTNLLTQFRDWGRTNLVGVNRSIAHMFSGVNGIGGIAYLEVLCNYDWGYAVDGLNNNIVYPAAGYVWDTDVTSHELGHNVGSPHTHSCSWAPPIDSCYTAEGGCFTGTKAVKGTIMSYCHLTAQGTNLQFHARVQTLMRSELAAAAACVPLISDLAVNAGNDTTVCPNTTSTLRVTTQGGTGPFTYSWSPTTYLTNPTSAQPTVTPARTTSYVCTVTDAMGMVRRDTVKVTVNAQMVLSNPPTVMICEGESVVLDPSITSCGTGTITYTWSPTANLSATTTKRTVASPTTTTPYTCTAVHECGDTARITINVGVYERPRVFLPSDATICRGDYLPIAAQITRGAPTYTLQWSVNGEVDPTLDASTIEIRPDSSLRLVLKATDLNGCVGYDTMNVTVNVPPVVTLPELSKLCAGEEIEITASIKDGAAPYSTTWLLGKTRLNAFDTTLKINAMTTGTLFCIVTDARGCSDTASTPLIVRSLDLALQPNRVTVPSMEACQNEISHTVELRNTSTDTVRIVSVTATRVIPAMTLPVVIPPGATTSVTVKTVVPFIGEVRDTIRFNDQYCKRTYILPLGGVRSSVRPASATGIDLAAMSACEATTERIQTVSIRNNTKKDVVLRSLAMQRTTGLTVTSNLPLTLKAEMIQDISIVIRGVFPEGELVDTIIASYTSPGCEGTMSIPIRATIAPYELGAPESIDFGLGQSNETIARTVTLIPDVTGVSQLNVSRVKITGPFQTDLAVGAKFKPLQKSTITVLFIAAIATTEGKQTGVLEFDIDGCPTPTSIALNAETPVSVQDDISSPHVWYEARTSQIIVRDPSATLIRIVDVLGRTEQIVPTGDVTRVSTERRGAAFVVVTSASGNRMWPVMLR